MKAIRKLITSKSEDLTIRLPDEFKNKKLEVIILPYNENEEKTERRERLLKIYNQSKGVLPEGYKFNREEIHER
ncbi:MAG: hypothetical protein E3K37_18795 [Candidatus Kuenenia sp.]|nr:hypothetical protein [Candidatus Kuenenia hertensis]